ncbi:MAG: glycerophosphodiester phosphodiesterase [Terriglobales bacterium]
MNRPLLFGHRGARRYAPENTLAAFELALEHGCDGFEFDVRVTADSHAIICHDAHLARRDVARSNHPQLLERCPSLTTLDKVLAGFASRAYLYIELKVACTDQLLHAIRTFPPQRGFVVASFLPEVLTAVHGRNSDIPLGFICDNARELRRWRELPLTTVMPKHTIVTPSLLDELHGAGKQVFVWTVNGEREMLHLCDMGVDGIVSDDTRLLCRLLRRQAG